MSFWCSIGFLVGLLPGCEPPQLTPLAGYIEGEYTNLAPVDVARVASIRTRRGERVPAGTLLAKLDDKDAVLAVRQAEASLAQSRSDFFAAQSNLRASVAAFRQYVGVEPRSLSPAKSVEAMLPKQLKAAVDVSQVEHPAIGSALHNVDVAAYAVKVAEAALYPTLF